MTKKRHSVWNGIRDAYNVHEAMQLLDSLQRSGGHYLTELREMALMVIVLAIVCLTFWLMS
ncbi:hypothetical protein [Bradyrhizobium genomosp. III]|uniref:hypothetical protein n=1 Tax=Bradyrhizobium genomosp. III TaxID=2683271 RepID=UPI0004B4B111|nr:hypothetical protein [Bradyrhizobium sp. CCBAU 15544]